MRIIAGPCQHESLEHSLNIAGTCARACARYGIDYYFKASYDKANRTSASGKRGQGLESTMTDFYQMKKELPGLKILTDIHSVEQINEIMEWYDQCVDVLQIPAFLCRQTDLVQAACATGKIVNIKKGQFLAPWDVAGILSKTQDAKEVWITERGTSFGYNTLVVDFTGLDYLLNNYSAPIVFDVTHSVQKPGGNGASSGGNREYVSGLARAASALGVQNFFIEVHPDPDNAPSDGPNMVQLNEFDKLISNIVKYNYER
jgi:2-dehydro-3-deoxyphosphooctonate aldolase (KDO 8-P synthase)